MGLVLGNIPGAKDKKSQSFSKELLKSQLGTQKNLQEVMCSAILKDHVSTFESFRWKLKYGKIRAMDSSRYF